MAAADLARSVKVEWKCQSASKTASTASCGESKLTATERDDVEQSPATVRQLAVVAACWHLCCSIRPNIRDADTGPIA